MDYDILLKKEKKLTSVLAVFSYDTRNDNQFNRNTSKIALKLLMGFVIKLIVVVCNYSSCQLLAQ